MIDKKRIDEFLNYWFTIIKLYLRIKTYELFRWIAQPSGKSRHKFSQKIAILGDEFALGFGDKLRLGVTPGIGQAIHNEMARDNRIKQNWSIFNLGVYGSTTRDWLPVESTKGVPNHPHLLESQLLSNPKLTGCKIIGIMVGFNDYRASPELSPEVTLENIKLITKHLSELGFIVYLFTIPSAFSANSSQNNNLQRSQLLKEFILCGEVPNLHLGVEIDESNYEFKRRTLYVTGTSYFNSTVSLSCFT
ncbi:hypothetical protein DSO57_1013081 [Entomophthora muscae]|uniref:Uncharacterized protein n=1 Tax=Entomophthora muscae TaxID=34485 RepID=A0ACC2SIP4_9FUNG|nr:hypothetical protein DSO57_1013081 [Entomophthora muscae]